MRTSVPNRNDDKFSILFTLNLNHLSYDVVTGLEDRTQIKRIVRVYVTTVKVLFLFR